MAILVTGAAGFIGSNFVSAWFNKTQESVVSLDLLTYAGNLENLSALSKNSRHHFIQGNITDSELVKEILHKYEIRSVIHFAGESHVDQSITTAVNFIETNIVGTYKLLESVRTYWQDLNETLKKNFRFLHISTDEVYGSIDIPNAAFNETYPYKPNNPYSASKAASNHLVRAWFHTYEMPTLTTNCSNNYGPYQFPEKLIPLSISNALNAKPITIYGDGKQVRDWIYVKDHCDAIYEILDKGRLGETYNIGASNEKTNLEVVHSLCHILDELKPKIDGKSYADQIVFINDRPGHDKRYAIDTTKIKSELSWKPAVNFDIGLRKTVMWYLENQDWINHTIKSLDHHHNKK